MWMFAALSTVEPPILELATSRLLEGNKTWSEERLPLVADRVRDRLNQLSGRLSDAGWQIGYLLEPLENGWVAAFVPQAPTPMSGNVMYMPSDRVRPLDITMVQAMSIVKAIGVGSGAALRGVDLKLPSADN